MNGRELAEALLALDDPDLPVRIETSWDGSSCGCCYETAYGTVSAVGLRVENGAILFDEGDPTYCASWRCKHEGRYEGPDGKLYCDQCHDRIQRADAKAAAEQREADYKAAWRQALAGVG